MADRPDVVVAHGGTCPNGYIFDHDKSSKTYGKCIWASLMKPAAKTAGQKKPKVTRKLGSYVK
jgi:hypothetical protein